MKLTLVTVTYNAEAFLERTLRSVAVQTHQPDEYLLIDGRSTDGTLRVADRYASLFAEVVSEPDEGLYDAMNKGLHRATGDFVWFLNAGDTLHDEYAVARVKAAATPEVDVVYGETLYVDGAGQALGLRSEVTPHALPRPLRWQDFRLGMVVCHQAFVARRSVAPPYDARFPYSADIDWEIECLKRARLTVAVDGILVRYLTGGFSKQHHRASLLDRYAVLRKHFGTRANLLNHARIVARKVGFEWR